MRSRVSSLVIILLIVQSGFIGVFSFEADLAGASTFHAPILIDGDAWFTSANGVTAGNGTEADPYIIEGWMIDSVSIHGIELRNITNHFVIKDVIISSSGQPYYNGIKFVNVSNGSIQKSTITGNHIGLCLERSSNNFIFNNNISSNNYGIYMIYSSNNNTIQNNIVGSNGQSGIEFAFYSNNNTIEVNEINNNYGYACVITFCQNITIVSNNITNNYNTGIYIQGYIESNFINVLDNNVSFNNGHGIMSMASWNEITGNTVMNNSGTGINVQAQSGNNVTGNKVSGNLYGIYTLRGSHSNIVNNKISDSLDDAVIIDSVELLDLTDNEIIDNQAIGIVLEDSSNVTIRNNKVQKNNYGCTLEASHYNTLDNNNISRNNQRGIILYDSNWNNITNNKIFNHLGNGIQLWESSNNNSIYGNEIVNNTSAIYFNEAFHNTIDSNILKHNINVGISFGGAEKNLIRNNKISSNGGSGMDISYDSNNNRIVSNELFNDNIASIKVFASSSNLFQNNKILESKGGLQLNHAMGTTLKENRFINSGLSLSGDPGSMFSLSIDTTNTANGKPIYFMKNQTGSKIPSSAGQIFLLNCTGVLITGQDIRYSTFGIYLFYSNRNIIRDNVVNSHSTNGIYLYFSNNNEIENNIAMFNRYNGIELDDSVDNLLTGNKCNENQIAGINIGSYSDGTIVNDNICNSNGLGMIISRSSVDILRNSVSNNSMIGIQIMDTTNIDLSNNSAESNGMSGLYVSFGDENNIHDNIFSNNGRAGIEFSYSDSNEVSNNTISGNSIFGIHVKKSEMNLFVNNAIWENPVGLSSNQSRINKIYHNNFIDNTAQIKSAEADLNYLNESYPMGGNYWSDHVGSDLYKGYEQDISGRDGISDTPYVVNDLNIDFYPLMKPWGELPSAPGNLNATPGDGNVELNWDPPLSEGSFPVMNYLVYRGEQADNLTLLVEVDDHTILLDTGVVNGLTYYYQVRARQQFGAGPLSEMVTVFVGTVPEKPVMLNAEPGDDNINLTWYPPVTKGQLPITYYRIYKGFAAGALMFLKKTTLSTYLDEDVTSGVTYYYAVSAVNMLGEGPQSDEIEAIIYTVPSAPLGLKAKAGDSYVYLSWEPPLMDGGYPVEQYYIYRSNATSDIENIGKTTSSVRYYNDTDVINGVTYTYMVKAWTERGRGPFSEAVEATPAKIIIRNELPRAFISSSNTTGPPPLTVEFYGSGIDTDGTIVAYKWDFGDGTTSIEQNPVHTYNSLGTFYVKLLVYDNNNGTGSALITIIVEDPNIEPHPTDEDGTGSNENGSIWPVVALGAFSIIFVIIILVLFVLPVVLRKTPEPEKSGLQKREIIINRILKIKKGPKDTESAPEDEELLEE